MSGPVVTLADLARALGCTLEGDGQLLVRRVATLEDAGPGDVSFLTNPKYRAALRSTRATAVIMGEDAPAAPCAVLRSSTPQVAVASALSLLSAPRRLGPGVHPTAVVEEGAELGADVHVGPLVTIESGARIGARTVIVAQARVAAGVIVGVDCLLHAHVSLRDGVVLGDRVILQDGVVVGADGYGFAPRPDGSYQKIPQLGQVVIEDDVEIGANSTIDRPAVGETRIGAGTKIDNLVHVAHGVRIGRHVLLCAQVGIAGSVTIEDHVVLGGQVGVAGHVTLGRGARATAQTGIPNSLEAGAFVSGYPGIDNRDWLKACAVFKRLPDVKRLLGGLARRVAALEAAGPRPDDVKP